jgi:hypothetical protein
MGAAMGDEPKEHFPLPIEFDFDSGAANGDAIISRLIPVNSFALNKDWWLVNVALAVIADAPGGTPGSPGNPESIPGPKVFGLGDLTDVVLLSPAQSNGFRWGVGVVFGLPVATDDSLGSGKWSAGPAIRLGYQSGPWRLGMLAGNLKSFAGESDRADVNQLLVRGLVRRKLGNNWYFVYSPIITANWNASSGQRWLVPLGGGFGKSLKFRSNPANISVQAYSNVVKPDGAPVRVLRVAFVLPVR